MDYNVIKDIVTNKRAVPYRIRLTDGTSKVVRLWLHESGVIAIMNKGKKKYGHELSHWDGIDKWTGLKLVEHKEKDWFKLFIKRANDALKMLNESGLWPDIKGGIEHFLSLSESEQKELVNDINTDCYEKFYKETHEGGKYEWVGCHQVFESFASRKCWKSIAWGKWERERMTELVREHIKNGTKFSRRWENGYDNSIDVVVDETGYKRAWYSEEYRGCGNGHYYLLFDATHAIFYEDD